MGCIMMRVCHLDTCPVGIATQDPKLREKFAGQAEHVVNFFQFIAEEVRELMAQLGFRTIDEMIGRSDLLDMKQAIDHCKAQGLDFSKIFYRPEVGPDVAVRKRRSSRTTASTRRSTDDAAAAVPRRRWSAASRSRSTLPIRNVNRTVGTILGSELTRRVRRRRACPTTRSSSSSHGSAGQSFGAFVPRGITLTLEGDANDYVGKGLSGGKIIVYPAARRRRSCPRRTSSSATSPSTARPAARPSSAAVAGERFCVRNSGAMAVVEGIGDHGCEYMTGGVVVVLGPTGRNFAAGMSGGIAFVFDEDGDFPSRCNLEMVDLEPLREPEDIELVRDLLIQHAGYTGSTVAARILSDWDWAVEQVRQGHAASTTAACSRSEKQARSRAPRAMRAASRWR